MFKVLVYAYSQGIYSSRKIEQACRRNINFMWLLAGSKASDHCTIARFRTHFWKEVCEDLFGQLARILLETGEVGFRRIRNTCRRVWNARNAMTPTKKL